MQTIKQEYRQFLNDHFKKLKIKANLFYNWKFGLRFNLQNGETDTEEYFEEVAKRANTIFENSFEKTDNVFLVYMDYKYKRRKIRFSNFTFNQIDNLRKTEVDYSKKSRIYEPNDKFDLRNIAVIKLTADRINYKNILTAIANSDFPPRQPSLGFLTSKEVYFINIDKKLVFYMYDDRGLDLISSDKETLKAIYTKYNSWLLEYDREQIDRQFE